MGWQTVSNEDWVKCMFANMMCNKFWVYLYNIEEPIQVTLTHDEKCEVDCSIGGKDVVGLYEAVEWVLREYRGLDIEEVVLV